MSLLSDQQVLTPEFLSGLELLNGQDESKVSQIFSRIMEFEIEIRSNPERNKTSAFTSSEKQKLRSVLNEIQSQEQVCCFTRYSRALYLKKRFFIDRTIEIQIVIRITYPCQSYLGNKHGFSIKKN